MQESVYIWIKSSIKCLVEFIFDPSGPGSFFIEKNFDRTICIICFFWSEFNLWLSIHGLSWIHVHGIHSSYFLIIQVVSVNFLHCFWYWLFFIPLLPPTSSSPLFIGNYFKEMAMVPLTLICCFSSFSFTDFLLYLYYSLPFTCIWFYLLFCFLFL